MSIAAPVWVVVLIKDFEDAKRRLSPALAAPERRDMAWRNAGRALAAAAAGDHVLAVCGGVGPAELAEKAGVAVLREEQPRGQNHAARSGIERAMAEGAGAVLLLSSDLPLVTRRSIAAMLRQARRLRCPGVLAAPASGRGGTNALYLAPPDVITLHFGDRSLVKFEQEARERNVRFVTHHSRRLALDVDEPADLAELARVG